MRREALAAWPLRSLSEFREEPNAAISLPRLPQPLPHGVATKSYPDNMPAQRGLSSPLPAPVAPLTVLDQGALCVHRCRIQEAHVSKKCPGLQTHTAPPASR